MDTKEFESVLNERLGKIRTTLTAKADEYARGDRLSNFKSIGSMLGCTSEKALIGLVSKHWVALLDFVADIDKGKIQSRDRWEEKIGDICSYMILLEAMVRERKPNNWWMGVDIAALISDPAKIDKDFKELQEELMKPSLTEEDVRRIVIEQLRAVHPCLDRISSQITALNAKVFPDEPKKKE